MKSILFVILFAVTTFNVSARLPLCGKVTGFSYNQDSIERPYSLSGFWVKQNTDDLRVTYGTSSEMIETIQELANDGSLFVCLDNYTLVTKKYSGKKRTYAHVKNYRVWLNGVKIED